MTGCNGGNWRFSDVMALCGPHVGTPCSPQIHGVQPNSERRASPGDRQGPHGHPSAWIIPTITSRGNIKWLKTPNIKPDINSREVWSLSPWFPPPFSPLHLWPCPLGHPRQHTRQKKAKSKEEKCFLGPVKPFR